MPIGNGNYGFTIATGQATAAGLKQKAEYQKNSSKWEKIGISRVAEHILSPLGEITTSQAFTIKTREAVGFCIFYFN